MGQHCTTPPPRRLPQREVKSFLDGLSARWALRTRSLVHSSPEGRQADPTQYSAGSAANSVGSVQPSRRARCSFAALVFRR